MIQQIQNCSFHIPEILPQNSVYEVIRVVNKIPLFIEDHFLRLNNTLSEKYNQTYASAFFEDLHKYVRQYISGQTLENFNIRIQFFDKASCFVTISPHLYPTPAQYANGVKTVSAEMTRNNPQLKIWKQKYKQRIAEIRKQQNAYEVLLFTNGYLTEGSQSTVFWVRKNILYTTPEHLVLSGITRQKVIELLPGLGISFCEKQVNYTELIGSDAVFLCGTSPMVLPVNQIDTHLLPVKNNSLLNIMEAYKKLIEVYLQNTN